MPPDKLDFGYIYIMIDSTPRADGKTLVKIGMTGATQTP
jgi:hypothetical protein